MITTNTWDALNRLVSRSVIETNGAVLTSESFGYEPGGLERFHTNALGGFTQTEYTTTGQPKYRLNADGSTNGWRYYLDGRVRREIQRNGAYWETTYDDANLTTTRIFYNGGKRRRWRPTRRCWTAGAMSSSAWTPPSTCSPISSTAWTGSRLPPVRPPRR